MLAELFAACAILGLLGVLALVAGVRHLIGIRRGDTPHCRRCRYDLSGLASPETCPECGRSLRQRRSIVRGVRRRRVGRGLGWFGAALGAAALIAGAWLSSWYWPRLMPSDYLVWRMTNGGKSAVLEASAHLAKRMEDGAMTDRTARKAAHAALRLRDTGVESMHTSQWARFFVDEAWARRLLSESEVKDYIENSVHLLWSARARRDGSGFLMVFANQNSWARDRQRLPTPFTFRVIEWTLTPIGGEPLASSMSRTAHWDELEHDRWMSHNSQHFITYEFARAEDAAPSVLRWRIEILDANTMQRIGEPWIGERTIDIPALMPSDSFGGTFRHRSDLVPPRELLGRLP